MADGYSRLNGLQPTIMDDPIATAAKYRSMAGVALFAFATLALSLYYLASADDGRYQRPLTARRESAFSTAAATEKYLVRGRKCLIQDVDPYDVEVRAFVKSISHVPCSKTMPLTYIVKKDGYSELHVDKAATRSYSPTGVSCCYSAITRGTNDKKPDDAIDISECRDFVGSVNTTDEFMIVKCTTRHRKKEVYKNAHAAVNMRPSVRERLAEQENKRGSDVHPPLSILMVGVDSVSRLNAMRTMPHTLEYLKTHGWIEMRGYNKIADNTFPNLMAVLTGIDGDSAYEACLPTELYRLDNCSFIWRRFRDNGYVTAYAEDEATISTFNFQKVGFVHPPTDYYLRPFMQAAQRELKVVERYSLKYCLGPVPAGERILSYAADFAVTFVNHTNFGLFWTNSFSHNDLNSPSGMDMVLARFFRRLHEESVIDRSLIVFFSDHGMRFGDVRQTKVGWFEERLPYLWISVPQWFREHYPAEWRAIRDNSARLTTPYDLHMTLQHVLVLGGAVEHVVPSSGCPLCHSLFFAVDKDRACEDAAISPHWCVCTAFRAVDIHDPLVKSAARYVVSRITAYVHEGSAAAAVGAPRKCAKLSLSKIIISQSGRSWDGAHTFYLLFVETLPGRGKFEATVSLPSENLTTESTSPIFQLHSSISRLDRYADQSRCISSAFLKKYCYCR